MSSTQWFYNNKTTKYTSKWSHYFDIYDRYFDRFRGTAPVVVEIGVDNGGSLEVWREYFGQQTKVIGIDNRLKVTDLGPQISLIHGEQGDPNFWDNFVGSSPNLDIVIDDGSHYSNHQILTFEKIFPHLSDGGIYMVEDTHTSYMSSFYTGLKQPNTFIEYCKNIIDMVHEDHYESIKIDWMRHINSIHFYDSVVVIEKKLREKNYVTYIHREDYV